MGERKGIAVGRHSASHTATPTAATYTGLLGSAALALGIAALTAGAGIANAEGNGDDGGGATSAQSTGDRSGAGSSGVKVRKTETVGKPAADRVQRLVAHSAQQVAAALAPDKSSGSGTGSLRSDKPIARSTVAGARTVDPFVRRLAGAADAVTTKNPERLPHKLIPSRATVAAEDVPSRAKPLAGTPVRDIVISGGGTPNAPVSAVLGALQLARREIENITQIRALPTPSPTPTLANAEPAIAQEAPSPDDEVPTDYGDIGKWMLKSDGEIANYGGQTYDGKTLLEPGNVIIVDPKSTSAAQANRRLNAAMFWSGFPAQPIHSTGFEGSIDDVTYGQKPKVPLLGYSDNFFIFPNDHGRIFGPDPVETDEGYVWTGAFSTEEFAIYNGLPAHTYVSSNTARAALAMALIASGRATYGGMVPLDNAYNTETTTTGDHDGYAVVLILT